MHTNILVIILVVFFYNTPKKSIRASYASNANHYTLEMDIKRVEIKLVKYNI